VIEELGHVAGAARRWLVLAQVLDDGQVLGAGRAARDGRRFELGAVAEIEGIEPERWRAPGAARR
jgi:hypothetical protein